MPAHSAQTAVWDWPVRLFHWLIVLLIPMMWWTAEEGIMDWHRRLGLLLFGLVLFRLIWGLFGSWTARFLPMLVRLRDIPRYIFTLSRAKHRPSFGHNPVGVLSVFALLSLLSVQIGTGLFSVDVDGLESGPLAVLVSFKTGRLLADIHEISFDLLVIFIALHITAILLYRFVLKDRLIKPMVTGSRPSADFASAPLPAPAVKTRLGHLIVSATIAAVGVYAVLEAG